MINPIFELLRNDGSIIINKALIHRLGLHEAIIYTELVSRYTYFSKESMLTEDGYFYNTVDDIQLATGLGEKSQNTSIKNLITLGLIDKKLKGTPARRHFKIVDNMNLILSFIEEGKMIIKELDQKQKERMKQKIKYSKFSSSKKTEVESNRDNISNSSSTNKTELSKINNSSNEREVAENISVPPIESSEFLQEDVCSSSNKTELIPAIGRINNTNTIILNNNTKKNREEDTSAHSVWNGITTILKTELTEVSFNTWISDLKVLRIENSILTINAPSVFIKEIIENRYRDLINISIKLANNSIKDFIIEI